MLTPWRRITRFRWAAVFGALLASILVNVALLTQIIPLMPYYSGYWDARAWVSQTLLRRERPDDRVIYQSSDFTLSPSRLPGPQFRLADMLHPEDPSEYQAELRAAAIVAFGLPRIPAGDPEISTLDSESLPGYIRHQVSYETQRGVWVPAYQGVEKPFRPLPGPPSVDHQPPHRKVARWAQQHV